MNKKDNNTIIIIGTLFLLFLFSQLFQSINAQTEKLPVLLIHGYAADASVWEEWKDLLQNDGIIAHSVTFRVDDKCGSAMEHAKQLNEIVEDFKMQTGSEKINIVAHSKGGLDTRAYLANNLSNAAIANLIMIGTPNEGSLLADRFYNTDPCKPAVFDLMTNSSVIDVETNPHTKYHTIAGNWKSVFKPFTFIDTNCPASPEWLSFQQLGRNIITGDDDGIVSVSSAQSEEFISLGTTDNCHTNLFGEEEYEKAREILFREFI